MAQATLKIRVRSGLLLRSKVLFNTSGCNVKSTSTIVSDESIVSLSNEYVADLKKGKNWNYKTELSALAARLGHKIEDVPSLEMAFKEHAQPNTVSKANGKRWTGEPTRLAVLGRSTMLFYVNEYLYFSYPAMDGSMLMDLSKAITNQAALVKLSKFLGVTELIRTKRNLDDPSLQWIISQSFSALIGAIFKDQGPKSAKKLVHNFIVSQLTDKNLDEVVKLQHPRLMLHSILASLGRPKPISRLLSESGRATHFPSFSVGIYSGNNFLGQGTGTSLKRAEQEAMVTVLRSHFEKELAAASLPSDLHIETELAEEIVQKKFKT